MNKGQSIFEVLIAVAISAMIMTVMVSLSSDSLSNSLRSKNKTLANKYVSETLEWLRWQREGMGWTVFHTNLTAGDWCLFEELPEDPSFIPANIFKATYKHLCETTNSADKITGTDYFRSMNVTSNADSINVNVKVVWQEGDGWHESESSTTFVKIN